MQIRYQFSGARVREERKRRRLSLEELSSKIGVTPPFLGQIELDKRKPSIQTFEKLLAVFKEAPEALMQASAVDDDLSCERRVASLLQGQPKERRDAILDSLQFVLKRLGNGSRPTPTPRLRK